MKICHNLFLENLLSCCEGFFSSSIWQWHVGTFFSHSSLSKLCKCLYQNIGVESIAQKKGKPFDINHLQWILTSIDYHVYKIGGRKPP